MGNNNNIEKEIQRETIAREVKGRGLFYGVIAVATFIIMAVGATFAYFTATTNSDNSAVRTGSTTLKLKYISYQEGWMVNDLIPAASEVVEYSFENQSDMTIKKTESMNNGLCKDDDGNSICSVYVFQVKNEARSEQTVSLDVISEENKFASLNAMAYEVAIPTDSELLAKYNKIHDEEENADHFNGINDPLFRKKISDDAPEGKTLIDVKDGDGNVLINKSDATENQINVYEPVFINREGVVKTLLKYQEGEDVVVPAIDRLLVNTHLPDNTPNPEISEIIDDAERIKALTTTVASNVSIGGQATKTFALVLYILDNNTDQTKTDAAKTFTGRVVVSSGDGQTGVSGTISVVSDPENENYDAAHNGLQSKLQG